MCSSRLHRVDVSPDEEHLDDRTEITEELQMLMKKNCPKQKSNLLSLGFDRIEMKRMEKKFSSLYLFARLQVSIAQVRYQTVYDATAGERLSSEPHSSSLTKMKHLTL